MSDFTTPNGKVITTYNEGFSVRIKFKTGGELPACLAGKYTASDHADTAIRKYLDDLSKKPTTKTKE